MEPQMKDSGGGIISREPVCPRCGKSGGVQFWEVDGKQTTLMGKMRDNLVRLQRPLCRKCGARFDRDEMQEEETRRL